MKQWLLAYAMTAPSAVSLRTNFSMCARITVPPESTCYCDGSRNSRLSSTRGTDHARICSYRVRSFDRRQYPFRRVPVMMTATDSSSNDVSPMDLKEDGTRSVSNYRQTSGPVKAVVGGLTDFFVRIAGGSDSGQDDIGHDDAIDGALVESKGSLSVQELEAGIRGEYAKNFLWTGDINEALYEEDCSFTDPTLSFSGLSTYKRNVASLQGVLDAVVVDSVSVLYSCQLRQEESCVQTRWRMLGDLRLPWGPTIDVVGRTIFSYDPERGNRIYSYDEVWEVEAAQALLQLFRPGRKDKAAPLEETPQK